ncbi:MAG TPA: tetratricopeptide repeat protein [Candidatus Acidoferrum sp.]|nr:tetratricopeptide repeat protein [Candidatus Acidoferrum sp.]
MNHSLEAIQNLYDQNQFVEAYRQSAEYWLPSQSIEKLSLDELILGGRMAARLGGLRLSRRLFRMARARYPEDARARYFGQKLWTRGWKLFEEVRSWEKTPELENADDITQSSWLASQGVMWAALRDFDRSHLCMARAKELGARESWVFSCESSALGLEDRWEDALRAAETSWELCPGTPYATHSLGDSLVNLRRIQEAAERTSAAAENCQSFEVVQTACWHVCALAETAEGEERKRILKQAEELAERLTQLAPLADRETRAWFARMHLDIAELKDDHGAMEKWAEEVRSPFHRKALENLRKNPQGLRVRMPFRRAMQKHDECLPISVASALAAMGTSIDAEEMAAEITFGGTPEWAAAEWLEKRGLTVRFFAVGPEIARQLIRNGFAFVMTLEGDANAHAVAAVGLDEATGTLIIHDPSLLRTTELLLESVGKNEAPLGPKGMIAVPREQIARLDALLNADDVAAMTARAKHHRAKELSGPTAAKEVVEKLAERLPGHPLTRLLKAMQAVDDGQVGLALVEFQELMKEFSGSAFVRARLLWCSRSLGDTAAMRRTLASVVERGALPGIQSQQTWRYPPGAYVSEYADLLRVSAETRKSAEGLLHRTLSRENTCAQAWHVLADLLWDERDTEGAVLAYRIAAGLATSNEHYARAYCDALGNTGKQEEGLQWLERRVQRFGGSSLATATWITWINALEEWGHPQEAINASESALEKHGDSPELLGFVAPFLARMGRWEQAEGLLGRLKDAGNSELYGEAAADFYRRRGELDRALEHARARVEESPLSMYARRELLRLIDKKDGTKAALELAAKWHAERPGHDELEQLYAQYLEQEGGPRWKRYGLMRRRVKRNPEDGWAWRQLGFLCVAEFEASDETRKKKIERRLPGLIAQCERTDAEDASTIRLKAEWCEAQGRWEEATRHWMNSIQREPRNLYGYRQVWACLTRGSAAQRRELWEKLAEMMLSSPGQMDSARDAIFMAANRFGVAEAEAAVTAWKKKRPNDPELTEAYADLLLGYGHGRSDAQRAMEMLQPEAERFPYHAGLRFSLADAQRRLGRFEEAEQTLAEIVRRHPENSSAQVQLARVDERHGRIDEALRVLEVAAGRDPRNVEIAEARIRILLRAARRKEARLMLDDAMKKFRANVSWRETAIELYVEMGDEETAVLVARQGVAIYPRGAYLWFLLGRTLHQLPRFAAQGEIEANLRRSLELNTGLFTAADRLAMVLVEQRQFGEAEEVLKKIETRLSDPSPARGRLAWIRRAQGERESARKELTELLREMPWYNWGWNVLMEWWKEDQAWIEARGVLSAAPPEQRTNVQFRRQRLMLLEKADTSRAELDEEWKQLLQDFPEEVSLHLHRYDSLLSTGRPAEAAEVLETIRPIDPESPYVLARYTEVLASDPKRKEESVESLMRVLFAETEESTWPATYAWKAVKGAALGDNAYEKACERLRQGGKPTVSALQVLAEYAAERWGTERRSLQPYWRSWFPERGAKEVVGLQKLVDAAAWPKHRYQGRLLKQLNDEGYARLVARYWRKHRREVEGDVDAWQETARALIVLRRKRAARTLMKDWRSKNGVGMWAIGNYVNSLTGIGAGTLREVRDACRDALGGLSHDHTAKYLAHRQAEACTMLGDGTALLGLWKEYRGYFSGKVEEGEWFVESRKYLLGDVVIAARALQENNRTMYGKIRRGLWWKAVRRRIRIEGPGVDRSGGLARWWWLIWLIILLLRALMQSP